MISSSSAANTSVKADILLVDDTPENLNLLSDILSTQGHKVRVAINGAMAIKVVRKKPPDLILLDINMPEKNGYEVCQELKQDPGTAEIPIIFISALDEVLDKVKAFQLGGVDYITKPFQLEEVLARVNHQLTIRQLQGELRDYAQQLERRVEQRTAELLAAKEAAEAASKAKTMFLAKMSHELRTPLNAIMGFSQLMLNRSQLDNNDREELSIIYQSGENLLEMINSILQMARLEAGRIDLHEHDFNLWLFLDEIEAAFRLNASTKGVKFVVQRDPLLPQYISTDSNKLRDILDNILDNAIKYTAEGEVCLRIQWMSESQIEFEVDDTGVGIAAEELDHLFEPFSQTESGRNSQQGIGLGLCISRYYIYLMSGEIKVTSQVGHGTVVKFMIPVGVAEGADQELRSVMPPVIALEPDQPTYRLLVVDDQWENRYLLVKLLGPLGFQVREASNGREAIALWESWDPHLIWMDMRMPILDGHKATQHIRSKLRGEATIIIALTVNTYENDRIAALSAGCDDFICKPIRESELFEKLTHYLGVRFVYASAVNDPIEFHPLTPEDLKVMPEDWIFKLYQASVSADQDDALALIQDIPPIHQHLATTLERMVSAFRLGDIVTLTQISHGL